MSFSDSKFSKNVLTTLLTNFAKTMRPDPNYWWAQFISVSWPPVLPTLHNVMRINTKLKLETDFNKERCRFWSETIPDLFKAFGKKAEWIVIVRTSSWLTWLHFVYSYMLLWVRLQILLNMAQLRRFKDHLYSRIATYLRIKCDTIMWC